MSQLDDQVGAIFGQYAQLIATLSEKANRKAGEGELPPWKGNPYREIVRLHHKASNLLDEIHDITVFKRR